MHREISDHLAANISMRLPFKRMCRITILPLFFAAVAFLSGCSSVSTFRHPKADFSQIKVIYVENRLGDDHAIDEMIVKALKELGYEASSGPLTMKPNNIDAIVFYEDRWTWDFKKYIIALNVTVKDARRGNELGTGEYYRPSPVSVTPSEMVYAVIKPLFRRTAAK